MNLYSRKGWVFRCKRFAFYKRFILVGLFWVTSCTKPADPVTSWTPNHGHEPDFTLNVDPNQVIDTLQVVVNRYSPLALDASVGAKQITVADSALFDPSGPGSPLAPLLGGDLVMVIQMQGADIQVPMDTQNVDYGSVSAFNSAGLYEFIRVASVDSINRTIFLDPTDGGLINSYRAKGHTQVIRVPYLDVLEIRSGASLTAPPWDGTKGGIVAFRARQVLLNGAIDVGGRGFRGGSPSIGARDLAADVSDYYGLDPKIGGQKGEGIAGYLDECQARHDCYGRGAVGNGGGGGNSYAAGGGGGGNGDNGNAWTGQGVMDTTDPNITLAWRKDPVFTSTGKFADSSGGGRGGYTQSLRFQLAASFAPGDAGWQGNLRRERGGLGGRPVPNNVDPNGSPFRLFMGGGGGGGSFDGVAADTMRGRGGNGGGIIFLSADHITMSPTAMIQADGQAGGLASGKFQPDGSNGGGGGGGAGGSIFIDAAALSGANLSSISAQGGMGGTQSVIIPMGGSNPDQAAGPGGGGGGGFIALHTPTIPAPVAEQGAYGKQLSSSVSLLFPSNGATLGARGLVKQTASVLGGLNAALRLDPKSKPQPGGQLLYHLEISNPSVVFFRESIVSGSITPNFNNISWTCITQGVASCPLDNAGQPITLGTGNPNLASIQLGSAAEVLFDITVPVPAMTACGETIYATIVDTLLGRIRSSAPVEIQAPVTLKMDNTPNPADGFNPEVYTISVTNAQDGCSTVNGLSVRFTMPTSAGFRSVDGGNAWDCQGGGQIVACKQKVGTSALSDIVVSLTPPLSQGQIEAKAEIFTPFSGEFPVDEVDLITPTTGTKVGALSGGGFCEMHTSSTTPNGEFSFLLVGLLWLGGLVVKKRSQRTKSHKS